MGCGDDHFFKELTLEDIDGLEALGVEGMRHLYSRLFANPGEWSWVIVGALPDDSILHEMVAKFLGIPASRCDPSLMPLASITPHLPVFTVGEVAQVHHGLAESAT